MSGGQRERVLELGLELATAVASVESSGVAQAPLVADGVGDRVDAEASNEHGCNGGWGAREGAEVAEVLGGRVVVVGGEGAPEAAASEVAVGVGVVVAEWAGVEVASAGGRGPGRVDEEDGSDDSMGAMVDEPCAKACVA